MQLFVALEVPAEVRENLASLLQSFRAVSPQIRWVRPENLHVTLARFDPPRLPETLLAPIRENAARDFGSLRASQFHLIESKLKPSGAEYTTVESFSFAAAEA